MASPLTVVVGALAMNLVVRVQNPPVPGRVVCGSDLEMIPAGVGGDLAVAVARLGAHAHLVARVGSDDLGTKLLSTLDAAGVATGFVTVTEGVSSGSRLIIERQPAESSRDQGLNPVDVEVWSAGANARLTPDDVDRALPLIRTAGVVLIEVGVPVQTVLHAIRICRRVRVPVVLDPVGWRSEHGQTPAELFDVNLLAVAESDARSILGLSPARANADERQQICEDLLSRGATSVVLREGELGALFASGAHGSGVRLHVPGFKVKAKDLSGSDIAFTAALALAHGEGKSPSEMLRFANAAAALSSMHHGVQPSFPSRFDVDDLVRRWI